MISTNRTRIVRALLITSALLCAANAPVWAQSNAASISGLVQDAQGAVVPNAKVTLTNEEQGAASARQIATNSEGTFVFSPVLPGQYTIAVEASGFKKYTQSHVTLNVNDRLGVPTIALEVGSTGESVTVEA